MSVKIHFWGAIFKKLDLVIYNALTFSVFGAFFLK